MCQAGEAIEVTMGAILAGYEQISKPADIIMEVTVTNAIDRRFPENIELQFFTFRILLSSHKHESLLISHNMTVRVQKISLG